MVILLVSGCSSLPLQKARTAFYVGNLVEADQILKECDGISQKNKLLCYMEKGLILFYMGAYAKSTQVLLKASALIKEQDQISIKDQSSAVLINDRVAAYKGEYCERLWVHTFLMMNFLLQHKNESALVEAKQALEVFDAHPGTLENDYFTRALVALCFENMNLASDARIEYEKIAAAMGKENLRPEPLSPGAGELVLFIGQGRVPSKVATNIILPPTIRISIPRYADSYPPAPPVAFRSAGRRLAPITISTDMGKVARKSLDNRSVEIFSRQALRAGAKEAIAQKIGENNQVVEVMARAVLFLLEEADTRSWEILPDSLTLVRIRLDPGVHDLEISSENSLLFQLNAVDIAGGERVYRSLRF